MMQFLYVVAPGRDGPCKIGHAKNPRVRLGEIQVGSFQRLYMPFAAPFWRSTKRGRAFGLGEMWVSAPTTTMRLEKMVHKALAGARLSGEWFDVSVPEAIKAIMGAADDLSAKVLNGSDLEAYARLYWAHGRPGDREGQDFFNALAFVADASVRYNQAVKKAA